MPPSSNNFFTAAMYSACGRLPRSALAREAISPTFCGSSPSIYARSAAARAGEAPPVEMPTVTSPRTTRAGKKKSQLSGSSALLTGMPRARQSAATRALSAALSVAATAKRTPSSSEGLYPSTTRTASGRSSSFTSRAHTSSRAPKDASVRALRSATSPPPASRQSAPSIFCINGKQLMFPLLPFKFPRAPASPARSPAAHSDPNNKSGRTTARRCYLKYFSAARKKAAGSHLRRR